MSRLNDRVAGYLAEFATRTDDPVAAENAATIVGMLRKGTLDIVDTDPVAVEMMGVPPAQRNIDVGDHFVFEDVGRYGNDDYVRTHYWFGTVNAVVTRDNLPAVPASSPWRRSCIRHHTVSEQHKICDITKVRPLTHDQYATAEHIGFNVSAYRYGTDTELDERVRDLLVAMHTNVEWEGDRSNRRAW